MPSASTGRAASSATGRSAAPYTAAKHPGRQLVIQFSEKPHATEHSRFKADLVAGRLGDHCVLSQPGPTGRPGHRRPPPAGQARPCRSGRSPRTGDNPVLAGQRSTAPWPPRRSHGAVTRRCHPGSNAAHTPGIADRVSVIRRRRAMSHPVARAAKLISRAAGRPSTGPASAMDRRMSAMARSTVANP